MSFRMRELMHNYRGSCTSLAVFDTGISTLKLPLVRPVSPLVLQENESQAGSSSPTARRESVGFLVHRYFEWVGTVEERMHLIS